jgi:uncharacterized RDD family membrane protein YckC
MFCIHCGTSLPSDARFCHACGKTVAHAPDTPTQLVGEVPASDTGPQIRPWVRYAARMIDVMIWAFPAGFLIGVFAPHLLGDDPSGDYALGWLVVLMWVFVEPLCLSVFGTTPGKWLLRIRLVCNGTQELSYGRALKRSVMVWWRGMGAGMPLIGLITLIVAYSKLKNQGRTSWDADGDFTVTHTKIGVGRTVLVFVLMFFYFFLMGAML